jgi:hypothetical protein
MKRLLPPARRALPGQNALCGLRVDDMNRIFRASALLATLLAASSAPAKPAEGCQVQCEASFSSCLEICTRKAGKHAAQCKPSCTQMADPCRAECKKENRKKP